MFSFSGIFTDSLVQLANFSRDFNFSSIGFSRSNWDILIVLFVLMGVFLYGVNLGRNKILVVIICTYLASVIFNLFPYGRFLGELKDSYTFDALGFIILIFLIYFFLSRSALKAALHYSSSGSWFQVFIFSILALGLILSNIARIAPKDFLEKLSPFLVKLFGSPASQFWWALLPIVFLSLIRRKDKPGVK